MLFYNAVRRRSSSSMGLPPDENLPSVMQVIGCVNEEGLGLVSWWSSSWFELSYFLTLNVNKCTHRYSSIFLTFSFFALKGTVLIVQHINFFSPHLTTDKSVCCQVYSNRYKSDLTYFLFSPTIFDIIFLLKIGLILKLPTTTDIWFCQMILISSYSMFRPHLSQSLLDNAEDGISKLTVCNNRR